MHEWFSFVIGFGTLISLQEAEDTIIKPENFRKAPVKILKVCIELFVALSANIGLFWLLMFVVISNIYAQFAPII